MAQNPTPELYLSLLSGRYGDVSQISVKQRHNDVGARISRHPFPNDRHRLMDLLDALAAGIRKEKGEVFFVSLSMNPNAATLYVSSNETALATVTSHLRKIRGQLKELRAVVEPNPSILADNETSPDPNKTRSRTEGELKLQKTIYEHCYLKLRRRFFKRAPAILAKYEAIMTSLQANDEDTVFLNDTRRLLEHIRSLLQNKRPPLDLTDLIQTIDMLSQAWQDHLKAVGDEGILTQWNASIYADQDTKLSLRRLLEKLFTLHHHIRATHRPVSPALTFPRGTIRCGSCASSPW